MKNGQLNGLLITFALGIVFATILSRPSYSQVPTTGDCLGAIPVCEAFYSQPLTPNGVGNYPNEVGTGQDCPYDCLWGEANSVWYIFTVQESGLLSFVITPVDLNDDYDWALYNLTQYRCEEIVSHMATVTYSCNSAGGAGLHGATGALNGADDCAGGGNANGNTQWNANIPVFEGQTFVLYISDWTQSPTGYTLDLSPSTAVIYDDVPPYIFSVDAGAVTGCDETEIGISFSENITCAGISPNLFTIEGPGGPYQIVDVYGIACDVGGEWEKDFILTVDHPFTSNGDYELYMSTGFPGIHDACNNIAPADTISFVLDLGAPVIDESGMIISDATCGMDNGSITGIEITGQTTLTYTWKNSQGAIVGTEPDLINISADSYTLEVNDLDNCITIGGPYIVEELGAPEIDDDNIFITPANFGTTNGSITGIIVTSPYTITEYIWEDDQGSLVGTELDLIGVSTGYYNLTVIDENTCEADAGPYFVSEIGGPLTAFPSANPEVICRGASTTLSPGAGGGSGSYEYTWSSSPAGFSSILENPVVTPIVNTTYQVEIYDGYINISGSVDVIVNQLPLPDAGPDQSIPHGTSTVLHGTASVGSGDYAYSWSPIDKLIDATLADPVTKNLYESTPFFLEIEDMQTGCFSEAPNDMTVNITGGILSANPSSYPDSIFCQGEEFWLHANAGGGSGAYTYTWTCSDPTVNMPSEPSFSLMIEFAGTYHFNVNVNDGYNDASGDVIVTISPTPFLNLGSPVQTYCIYDTITLDAGNPGSSYLWSNGDTNRFISVGTTGLGYDVQDFSVNVINAEGCEADTGVTIVFDYDACVGIDENSSELDARIYPNPSTGVFVVEVNDVDDPVLLQVFNVLGEIQYESEFVAGQDRYLKEEIDLSVLSQGIYLIKLQTNRGLKILEVVLK